MKVLALAVCFLLALGAGAQEYDLVILNGRVIDPESKLDAVRHLGIRGGVIRAVSARPLRGRATLDARGLMIAPGFMDLHSHGQDAANYRQKAMDGVTSALELEVGVADIAGWYAERAGRALIHYGASIGHIPVRRKLFADPGAFLPSGPAAHRAATAAEIEQLQQGIRQGLERGAVAVGFGIAYTPAASYWEILEMFRVAAQFGAAAHVHMRHGGEREPGGVQALSEVLAAAAVTGVPLHVVHINSSGGRAVPQLLEMIRETRTRGLDVTTECYPYTASLTAIESALYDDGWQERMGIDYKDLQWAATGERLTAESFARYRKMGGMVIAHFMLEAMIRAAVSSPLTMIASDGGLRDGKGHPRSSGAYARVLGRYVRETGALGWMEAIAKMTLMPAQRLQRRVPQMKNKGRIRLGADADLTLFDPERVMDRATYEAPDRFSEGIRHVLVAGVPVVKDGQLQEGVNPGRAIRAPTGTPAESGGRNR